MVYLLLGCCVCLAFVFGQSAVGKTRPGALRGFAVSAGPLEIVPAALRFPVAGAVVAVEVVLAVALLVGAGGAFVPRLGLVATAGFGLAFLLVLSFTAAVVVALRRGVRRPCECFGASAAPLSRAHVIRNVFLLAATVAGLAAGGATNTSAAKPAGVVVAVVAGLVGGLLVTHFDDLVDLFGSQAIDS